jgi:hypothetical protein
MSRQFFLIQKSVLSVEFSNITTSENCLSQLEIHFKISTLIFSTKNAEPLLTPLLHVDTP